MKKLLKYLKGYEKECVLGPLFKLLEATFELLVPLVVASIVDKGIGSGDRGYIVKMCAVMIGLGVVGLASSVTAQYFSAVAAVGFSTRLRHTVLEHILYLSYSQVDKLGASTMITRMTSDINQVQTGLNLTLRLLLRSPFVVFGAMVMAFTIDFQAALVFAGVFLTPLLTGFGAPENVLPYAQTYVRITAIGFPFLILTTGGCHLIRADGSPNMAMLCNLIGAVINTVLDAIFVMVFHWGMAGAALATIIGQIISAIIVIRYLLHFKTVSLTKEHFRPQIEYISKTAQIGMASFFNQVAMMVVQIIMNNSLTHYGAASVYGEAIPLACAGIVIKVNQIFFSIVIGLSQGSQPVESFNYGAKNYDRVRKAFGLAATSGVIISIVSFVLFQIFPRQILGLFGTGEPEYFEFGVRFFRIFLFFIWLDALQPITSTFFTSIGKPAKGIFLSLTRQIIFFIPLLLILPHFMGIEGCIYCGPIADFLAAVVTIIMAFLEFKNMPKTNGE